MTIRPLPLRVDSMRNLRSSCRNHHLQAAGEYTFPLFWNSLRGGIPLSKPEAAAPSNATNALGSSFDVLVPKPQVKNTHICVSCQDPLLCESLPCVPQVDPCCSSSNDL